MAKRRNLKKKRRNGIKPTPVSFVNARIRGVFSKNRRYNRPPKDENQEEEEGDRDLDPDREV